MQEFRIFMKHKIVIAITAILLVAVGAGIVIFLQQRQRVLQPQPLNNGTEVSVPSIIPLIGEQGAPEPLTIVDTDNDRLSDEDERRYNTDPTKPDTDGDGLSDWEEVIIYETDPLKADTDGDNFSDSQEVRAGYDPRSKEPRQLP